MMCEFCGGETIKKRVKKHHWLHGKLYIVENVEAEVCFGCSERYYHASMLDKIDHLIEEKEHKVKEYLDVEVLSV